MALLRPHNDALEIIADVVGVLVSRTFVDMGSSVNIIYYDCWTQLGLDAELQPPAGSLFGFSGEMIMPIRTIYLQVTLGNPTVRVRKLIEFVILDLPSTTYKIILGRPA